MSVVFILYINLFLLLDTATDTLTEERNIKHCWWGLTACTLKSIDKSIIS